MTIEVMCHFGQRFTADPRFASQTHPCPMCGRPIIIPAPIPARSAEPLEFCNYCHQEIPRSQFDAHVAEHLELQEDGQQTDYATLPPELRASTAELARAPRWYKHSKCGEVTGMSEEIIQTYLVNPWFYLSDRTYCCGCEKHVRQRECTWEETGENLQTYTDRLRAAKPEMRPGIMLRVTAWVLSALRG